MMFVKPAPGLKVRDPVSRLHLPLGGAEVPNTSFWIRRLQCGDVIEAKPPQPSATTTGEQP
jgi:hypothetical protein